MMERMVEINLSDSVLFSALIALERELVQKIDDFIKSKSTCRKELIDIVDEFIVVRQAKSQVSHQLGWRRNAVYKIVETHGVGDE